METAHSFPHTTTPLRAATEASMPEREPSTSSGTDLESPSFSQPPSWGSGVCSHSALHIPSSPQALPCQARHTRTSRESSPTRFLREKSPYGSPRSKSPRKSPSRVSRSPSPRSRSPHKAAGSDSNSKNSNSRSHRKHYSSKLTSPIVAHDGGGSQGCTTVLSPQDLTLLSTASMKDRRPAYKGRRYSVCEGRRSPTERRNNFARRRASNEKLTSQHSASFSRCNSDGLEGVSEVHDAIAAAQLGACLAQAPPLGLHLARHSASAKTRLPPRLQASPAKGSTERTILRIGLWGGDNFDKLMMLFCVCATLITSLGILLLEPVRRGPQACLQ